MFSPIYCFQKRVNDGKNMVNFNQKENSIRLPITEKYSRTCTERSQNEMNEWIFSTKLP